MASVASILCRIKLDLEPYLPQSSIRAACREVGHRWRDRQFDPVLTLHLFVLQVLCFNTAMTHLRHLARTSINAASYCKARMRLPLPALQMMLRDSARAMGVGMGRAGRWNGLRVWLTDGSGTIAPDTPALQEQFPQPVDQNRGCGFPQLKILGLFDAFSGLIVEALCFRLYTHEQSKVCRLHPLLGKTDLLVGDEDDAENAEGEKPDADGRAEGSCGLLPGVQPGASDDAPGRDATGRATGANQLYRHPALDSLGQPAGTAGNAAGQSPAAKPTRTPRRKRSQRPLCTHDSTQIRIKKSTEITGRNQLRKWHSLPTP